jgi:hypothetical protein
MTRGPLSPDGRHQWDGDDWVPLPNRTRTLQAKFQVVFVTLVVIAAFALLGTLFVE